MTTTTTYLSQLSLKMMVEDDRLDVQEDYPCVPKAKWLLWATATPHRLKGVDVLDLPAREFDLVRWLVVRGDTRISGRHRWTPMRQGMNLRQSLAYELFRPVDEITRAINSMKKKRLVLVEEDHVELSEQLYHMLNEASWRLILRDARPPLVERLIGSRGWNQLSKEVEVEFYRDPYLSPHLVKDRVRVLERLDKDTEIRKDLRSLGGARIRKSLRVNP